MSSTAIWIRTNPENDLLNSLDHCLLCLPLARADARNWKWCVAAAHSAAQAAMVIRLEQAGDYQQFEAKHREALLAYFEASLTMPGAKPPFKTHLKNYMELYRSSAALCPDLKCEKVMESLNELRNHWTLLRRTAIRSR